jgi:hydrogenase maturation protein HypF
VSDIRRVRLRLHGAVQGVGFRPFVCRLAHSLGVGGWVTNDGAGVTIEVEGDEDAVCRFARSVVADAPQHAVVYDSSAELIDAAGDVDFRILDSDRSGERLAAVLPDIATCAECLHEVGDPADRRYGYAFTNCTNCGPRYSIIRELPYDRAATTMAGFTMCPECAREYGDIGDRRFHAQPNACPACGPQLRVAGSAGEPLTCPQPLAAAAEALRSGRIVAVKGIGGFQLMVDAANATAVDTLRARKRRPTRPFAVMTATLEQAAALVEIDAAAARVLESAAAPIVLLPRRTTADLPPHAPRAAACVAPGNPRLGVMLPAAPIHHLLLAAFGGPVVATSGNLSDEPICTDDDDACTRLAGIADLFLVHDRPIERHVDDSVADIADGAPRLLRRARGHAPLPVLLPLTVPPILAVGAQLKNALALSRGRQVFISQHIGDLETHQAQQAFERAAADLLRLYDVRPEAIARDLHPDYASTRWALDAARAHRIRDVPVQHHHAHLVACMAENGVTEPVLGVVWDGTGYGLDGTIWGGEFLLGDALGFQRTAHLLPFRLPGGDAAVREPLRVALALADAACMIDQGGTDPLHAVTASFTAAQRRTLAHMIGTGLNAPWTSSAGRLFDGIAALLGICTAATYEGEPAIRLEYAADLTEQGAYEVPFIRGAPDARVLDWRPMLAELMSDRRRGVLPGIIAARVHNGLARAIALQAELAGCERVALSGGCFQNRLLSERSISLLRARGFDVLLHRSVPPNDGGVALGQIVVAAARIAAGRADEGASRDALPMPGGTAAAGPASPQVFGSPSDPLLAGV